MTTALILPDTGVTADTLEMHERLQWFKDKGARVVTLTEEPAYEFYEMFVKTPKRVFIEWEGVEE